MTTRLFLIRHGATALSAEDCFAGSTDVELSDEGRRQAEQLSLRLSSQDIKAIYASPMRRTRETAEIIARPHALGLNTDSGLREIDQGRWETRRRADVEALRL